MKRQKVFLKKVLTNGIESVIMAKPSRERVEKISCGYFFQPFLVGDKDLEN